MVGRRYVARMGEMIEFPSNGTTGTGYLATPAGGDGPGVVVIQEWWGLVPHIKDVADRFAAAGFVALAPDLYHGVATTEPNEAGKMLMALNIPKAAKDMGGAIDELQRRTGRDGVGVVGFCMGGGLTMVLACLRPDAVRAIAPFYGVIPWPDAQPDWSALTAKVEGHFAEDDGSADPASVHALEAKLRGLGKDVTMHIYPGTQHAFFNDARPEVYDADASAVAWDRTLALFRSTL
jgi:carboxymethylenebutenolidase